MWAEYGKQTYYMRVEYGQHTYYMRFEYTVDNILNTCELNMDNRFITCELNMDNRLHTYELNIDNSQCRYWPVRLTEASGVQFIQQEMDHNVKGVFVGLVKHVPVDK